MKKATLVLTATLAVIGAVGQASHILSAIPDDDSYIDGNAGNQGTNDEMWVKKHSDPDYTDVGYLKFDMSFVTDAGYALSDITSAELVLQISPDDGDPDAGTMEFYSLADGTAGENWSEDTIVYGNAPGWDSDNNQFDAATTDLMGTVAVTADVYDPVSFSNAALTTFVSGTTSDDFVTVMLYNEGNLFRIASKQEPGYEPVLTVTVIPEPAAAALLAVASVMLLRRRKR